MQNLLSQLLKYGLIGVINTLITLLLITFLTLYDINPYASNVIGYSAGLLSSFTLNSRYTFNMGSSSSAIIKFCASFALAYLINICILHYFVSLGSIPVIFAQIIAMLSYNIAFFALMKVWVFTRV